MSSHLLESDDGCGGEEDQNPELPGVLAIVYGTLTVSTDSARDALLAWDRFRHHVGLEFVTRFPTLAACYEIDFQIASIELGSFNFNFSSFFKKKREVEEAQKNARDQPRGPAKKQGAAKKIVVSVAAAAGLVIASGPLANAINEWLTVYKNSVEIIRKESPECAISLNNNITIHLPPGREQIKEVKGHLERLGFDPGPLDGYWSPLVTEAVKKYEISRKKPQTGSVDHKLLEELRKEPASRR